MLPILFADFDHMLNLKAISSMCTTIEPSSQPSAADVVEVGSWNDGLSVGCSLGVEWFGFNVADDELGD